MKFSIDWGTKVKGYSEKFLWWWLEDKNVFWLLLSLIFLLPLYSCITTFWSTMDCVYDKWSHKIIMELKIPIVGWHQSHSNDIGTTLLTCAWWCWYKPTAPPVVSKHHAYNYVYYILVLIMIILLCYVFTILFIVILECTVFIYL